MAPVIISGNIGQLDPDAFRAALQKAGIDRIDTAARYGGGESEKIIGRSGLPRDFIVDTKIFWAPLGDGMHSMEAVEKSLENSLNVLGVEKVNVLYCHGADFQTPVEKQARAFDTQYKKGRFNHLGVSNFSPKMLGEWLNISEKEGLVKPTVYQGQYNLVCRTLETELFPLLRDHNIAFNAYSPLAGGFLLGNFTAEGLQRGSRFSKESPSQLYRLWYDKPELHEAVRQLRSLSEKVGLDMDELSLRWLAHHSVLAEHDGFILGGSKATHFERSAAQIKRGPLDDTIVAELNRISEAAKKAGTSIMTFVEDKETLKKALGG